MAALPNQNNLYDVVSSISEQLKTINEKIADYIINGQKMPLSLKIGLRQMESDMRDVVEFVNETEKLGYAKALDELNVMFKGNISATEELSKLKFELLDYTKFEAIISSTKNIANFVKKFNKIKIQNIDSSTAKSVEEVIDTLFATDDGLVAQLSKVGPKLDNLSYGIIFRFKVLQYSIVSLRHVTDSLVAFGMRAALFKPFIKVAHDGVAGIASIVSLLAGLIDEIYSIKQLKGGVMKIFGPHKRLLLLRLVLKSLTKLIIPMIKLGASSHLIKPFRSSIPEYTGVISDIADLVSRVSELSLIVLLLAPLRIKLIKNFLSSLSQLLLSVMVLAAMPTKLFTAAHTNMAEITRLLTDIKGSLDIIRSFGLVELILAVLKIALLDTAMSGIIVMMLYLGVASYLLKFVIPGLELLESSLMILGRIVHFIDDAFKIKTIISVYVKSLLLRKSNNGIIALIANLAVLGVVGYAAAVFYPGLLMVEMILIVYSGIVHTIRKTRFGLLFNIKVRRMMRGARLIKRLVREIIKITRVRGLLRATVNMMLIAVLIHTFAFVVSTLMATAVLLLLFVVVSPAIILSVLVFGVVMRLITRVVLKSIGVKSMFALTLLATVMIGLTVIGLALLAIALMAPVIVDNALNIILFFGVIVAVTLAIGAIGFITSFIVPYLIPALYAVGIIAAMIFAVLAMAVMLKWIQNIELDQEKIKENVKMVMDTVLYIITSLFDAELNDPESKDNAFVRILKVLGGAVTKIIMAIATCAILVATFVSVACILMIVLMLKVIQGIKLDQEKIIDNVDTVFDTVEKIIERFMAPDPESKKSNRGILGDVIAWISPDLAKLTHALLSVAYLFLMFFAVAMVLGMATMLRLIQNLNLKPDEIEQKVTTVFDTVDQIINRIFGPRKDKENKSNRGILITIVSWFDEGLAKICEAALSIVYLALILISIVLVLTIAAMLRGLQELNLNFDQIKKQVAAVFDTADYIVERVFGPRNDQERKSSRGILVTLISWVSEPLAKIFEVALSIVYLALIMAAITIVLGIAGLLRALQEIDLKYDLIKDNVKCVFDTADYIINRTFSATDDSTQPERGIFSKIIGFFSPGLANILDALQSIAYLAIIFAAIAIVKGIAQQLKTIQDISIDTTTVTNNVDKIFDCVSRVMKKVYEKADTSLPEPKNRGIFGSIIGFFSPGLADILDALTMIAKLAVVQTAISAVAGIGKALKQINDIDTDLSSAKDKVDAVMGIAENVCTRIFSRESKIKFPVPPKERQSVFGALITWAFGGKTDEDRALEAAMKKVEALGIIEAAVGALGNILEGAKRIVDLEVDDLSAAAVKVDEVMAMSEKLAESIFNSNIKFNLPEPSNDEVQAALIELGYDHWYRSANAGEKAAAKAQAKMKLAMQRVETLGLIASALGSIGSMIEGINNIKNFEIPETDTVKPQVQKIMQLASDISFMIFNQDGIGQSGGNALGIKQQITEIKARVDFAKAGADGATSIMASYAKLIEAAKMSDTEIATAKSRTTTTLSAIGEILAQADSIKVNNKGEDIRNNCDLLDRVSKTIRTFAKVDAKDVKNSRDITDNYIKFLRKVDSMDLKKLQHTDYLMRSWASISKDLKGDFNGLAKTINEQIMPMIDALNKTLGDATRCQKEIITELTKPIDLNVPNSSGVGSVPIDSSSTGSFGGTDTDMNAPVEPTGRADGGSTQSNGSTSPTSPVRNNQKSTQTTQQTSLPNWPNSKRFEPKSGKYYKILVTEWEPA